MLRLARQAALALAVVFVSPADGLAQAYPSRPITIIVTFPPGGSSDIVARALVPQLEADLGQSILIDNRPGAGGNIGIGALAKAAPDGYTLGVAAAGVLAVNPHLNRNMSFDPLKDLTPITMMSTIPFVLAASQGVPVGSLADVIALAKADPAKLSIGHGGNGTAMHLTAALFTQRAQIRVPLVAYRGTAPAANDVLGGHIPLAVLDIPTSVQLIRDGRLKGLAVSSAKRISQLPETPSFAEAGLPGYESVGWFGLVAPVGTPAEIVTRLNGALVKALQEPSLAERLRPLGAEPVPSTPEAFAQFIRSESDKWAKVVAEAGVKAD